MSDLGLILKGSLRTSNQALKLWDLKGGPQNRIIEGSRYPSVSNSWGTLDTSKHLIFVDISVALLMTRKAGRNFHKRLQVTQ